MGQSKSKDDKKVKTFLEKKNGSPSTTGNRMPIFTTSAITLESVSSLPRSLNARPTLFSAQSEKKPFWEEEKGDTVHHQDSLEEVTTHFNNLTLNEEEKEGTNIPSHHYINEEPYTCSHQGISEEEEKEPHISYQYSFKEEEEEDESPYISSCQYIREEKDEDICTPLRQYIRREEEEEEEETYTPRRQYTLGNAISVAKLRTSTRLGSQRKTTSMGPGSQRKSINSANEDFPPLSKSEKGTTSEKYNIVVQPDRTIPEKKEDTYPFLQQHNIVDNNIVDTNSLIQYKKETTSWMLKDIPPSHFSRMRNIRNINDIREKGQLIQRILHHLVPILSHEEHEIFGFWQCEDSYHHRHVQQLYPSIANPDFFFPPREKEKKLSLNSLKEYLNKTPEYLYYEFCDFCDACSVCDRGNLITSFRIYTRPKYPNEDPTLEVICHLFWNDHYRVFGEFKCQNCWKKWMSAYIWISFKKFIERTPGWQLRDEDFYMQKCKKCKAGKNDSFITQYEPLKISDGSKPHKRELCAKCQNSKEPCRRTGDYMGKKA